MIHYTLLYYKIGFFMGRINKIFHETDNQIMNNIKSLILFRNSIKSNEYIN